MDKILKWNFFFFFMLLYIDRVESTPLVNIPSYIRDLTGAGIFHILTGEDIDDFTDIKFPS